MFKVTLEVFEDLVKKTEVEYKFFKALGSV
jgi:hypothetical protein